RRSAIYKRFNWSSPMITPVQIKICGVTNVKDARVCSELGISMIGFNFYPQSSRYIEPALPRRIIETISPRVLAVGVFVDASAEDIRTTADATGVRCVQLHGGTSPHVCSELAREFRVIRAFSTAPQFQPEEVSLFSD